MLEWCLYWRGAFIREVSVLGGVCIREVSVLEVLKRYPYEKGVHIGEMSIL